MGMGLWWVMKCFKKRRGGGRRRLGGGENKENVSPRWESSRLPPRTLQQDPGVAIAGETLPRADHVCARGGAPASARGWRGARRRGPGGGGGGGEQGEAGVREGARALSSRAEKTLLHSGPAAQPPARRAPRLTRRAWTPLLVPLPTAHGRDRKDLLKFSQTIDPVQLQTPLFCSGRFSPSLSRFLSLKNLQVERFTVPPSGPRWSSLQIRLKDCFII